MDCKLIVVLQQRVVQLGDLQGERILLVQRDSQRGRDRRLNASAVKLCTSEK